MAASQRNLSKNELGDCLLLIILLILLLLNLVIAEYCDLSDQSFAFGFTTDKSQYFAQPRSIIC